MKNNENTGGEDLGTQPTSGESKPEGSKPKKIQLGKPKHDELYGPPEIGGPKGLEPTRYGDWERRGRCIDF